MSAIQPVLFSKKHRSSGQNDHSYSRSRSREFSKHAKKTLYHRSRSPKRSHHSSSRKSKQARRRSRSSSERERRRKRSSEKKERHRRSKSRDDHKSRRRYEKEGRRSPSKRREKECDNFEGKPLHIVKKDSKNMEDRFAKRMLVEYSDLLEEGEVKDSSTDCSSPSEKDNLPLLQSSREVSLSLEESPSVSISSPIENLAAEFKNCWNLEKTTTVVQDPRRRFLKALDANQKLNLVLDLDETLIQACNMTQYPELIKMKGIPTDQLHVMNFGSQKIAIMVRPYAIEFIKRASKNYNLYIYSHGIYSYVEFVLDILDKERLYINRDRIFKNTGQVTGHTPKELANLGFSPEECSRTLILDDQKVIWKNEGSKVICSKKFMPFKQFSQLQKYNKYHLLSNDCQDFHCLSIEEEPYDLNYYLEKTHSKSSEQLQSVAVLLESIARNYLKNCQGGGASFDVETIYKKTSATVLKNMKVAVISSSISRKAMFEEAVKFLGGVLVAAQEAHYLIKDTSLKEKEKNLISSLDDGRPLLTILPVAWLMECFFTFDQADILRFKNLKIVEL